MKILLAPIFAAFVLSARPAADPELEAMGADVPIEALDCADCSNCGFGEHMMHSSPIQDPNHEGSEHSCEPGDCSTDHDRCFAEDEQDQEELAALARERGAVAERVRVAIATDDVAGLSAALEYPHVELNVTRRAVQVIGCGDLVVASFPLDPAVVVALQQ